MDDRTRCSCNATLTIQELPPPCAMLERPGVKPFYITLSLILAACAANQSNGAAGGWLLLVPQINQAGYAATDLPLSKWQTVGNFAGQTDCISSMQNQQGFALGQAGPITNAQNYNQDQALQILKGKCVSVDDPGLKAK